MIRRLISAPILGLSWALLGLSILAYKLSRRLRDQEDVSAPPRPDKIARLQFHEVEMINGPADGRSYPVPINNPPPRVAFRTRGGVAWYVPDVLSNGEPVLRWDGHAPSMPV